MFVLVPLGLIVAIIAFYFLYLYLDDLWRRGRVDDITKRYVLVTGCDSGFGNAIAKHLDKLGVHVFAGCLTEKGEEEVKRSCSSRVVALRLDVTDQDSIKNAVTFVRTHLPSEKDLWGLVNNAGLQTLQGPIEVHAQTDFERTLGVNLMGVIYVTRAFLPLLRKSRGRVVNISSDCGFITWPCRSAYCISKHGVESFTSCIRREMYHVGIKASTVQPGAFKTSIVSPQGQIDQLQRAYDRAQSEVREFYGKAIFDHFSAAYQSLPQHQETDLSLVTNAVEQALFSLRPKRSYRAGKDINGWIYPLSLLPVWFVDWYIAMHAPEKAKEEKLSNC